MGMHDQREEGRALIETELMVRIYGSRWAWAPALLVAEDIDLSSQLHNQDGLFRALLHGVHSA
jgi:hypothetical protein